jgi:hypothetical protein
MGKIAGSGIAWFALLLLAILLILSGIQGSSGRLLGIVFAPAILVWDGVTSDDIENPSRLH